MSAPATSVPQDARCITVLRSAMVRAKTGYDVDLVGDLSCVVRSSLHAMAHRAPEDRDAPQTERELVYPLVERGMPRQGIQWMILGAVASGALASLGHPAAGGAALAVGFAAGAWSASRKRQIRFRIEHDELVASATGANRPLVKTSLRALLDVRSAERSEIDLVRDLRDVKVAATSSQVARVVLVLEDRVVPLTEDQHPRADTEEWVRRLRVFLRSHRWVPEDERKELVRKADD